MNKKHRLSDRKVFESIIKSNKVYSKKYLIYFQKNSFNFFRVSINASKNKFKLAVDRNKIKRQLRSFCDQIKPNVSLDILIIVNKTYLNDSYQKNYSDFLYLIKKLEFFTKNKILN